MILSDIKSGDVIDLPQSIDNSAGELEIALCEIIYYPGWLNIGPHLGNNTFWYNNKSITIPQGYYDVCSLEKVVFGPLGIKIRINPANGLVGMSSIANRDFSLSPGLSSTLGNPQHAYGTKWIGVNLPKLAINKEIFIHLDKLSSTHNIMGGKPSNVLRNIPVKHEEFNSGRVESFKDPQFKKLESGVIPNFMISVLDANHNSIQLEYLSLTLKIK